jgi:FMN-dependent NADH-azoreductase
MSTILHIEASPRGARSVSSSLAEEFLALAAKAQPGVKTAKLPLWEIELPEFGETAMNAKFKTFGGEKLNAEEAAVWKRIEEVFHRFAAGDKYVFSVPMWNFGIPYKLKHFIDVVTQPRLAFSFDPAKGYQGLLTNRKAVLIAARGGAYSGMEGDPLDFQVKYMKTFLGFVGVTDVQTVLAEGLNIGQREASVAAAKAKLKEIAASF